MRPRRDAALLAGFNWSSSDTLVARVINVSLAGNFAVHRAPAPGTFAMRASASAVAGTATVTVDT